MYAFPPLKQYNNKLKVQIKLYMNHTVTSILMIQNHQVSNYLSGIINQIVECSFSLTLRVCIERERRLKGFDKNVVRWVETFR